MRSITASFLVLVSTQLVLAQPAESTIPKVILKNSPQHFAVNSLKLGAERFNARYTNSITIFITPRAENYGDGDEGYNGLAGELQYKRYISSMKEYSTRRSKKFYRGVYAGLFAQCGAYSGYFKSGFPS